jgi:dihydropteroate synthase-like protein
LARIALVTARRARGQVEEAARKIRESTGWEVDVVEAPVEIAALIPRDVLRRILAGLRGYDLVIVPGGLEYDVKELGEELGVPVARGPRDAQALLVLAELGEEGLARLREAGELSPSLLLEKWLRELAEHHRRSPGLDLCGLRVPIRPPPVIVAAEAYAPQGAGLESLVSKAEALAAHGADVLVLGPPMDWSREQVVEAARRVRESTGLPVALDTPDAAAAAEAIRRGHACMYMSVGLWNQSVLEELPRGAVVVVVPVGEGYSLPGSPLERVEALRGLVEEARRRGLEPVADPVLDPPGQGSLGLSVTSYYLASREIEDTPFMAGLANIYELLDADSHGQVAVLTQLLAEAGTSIMLVTEASHKTRMAVAEAKIAATMTSLSLLKRRQPKDLGIDLLYAKEKRPRSQGRRAPRRPRLRLDATTLSAWQGFRQDRHGSHLIELGPGGRIRDYYIGRKGTILVEGVRGEDLYRAAAYLRLASEPSHYSYLGYELCKAEYAALMRRSYVQEEPLIVPPWERGYTVYSPLQAGPTKLATGRREDGKTRGGEKRGA